MRSPDAAWVLRSRLATLAPEQKERFLPLIPDFVAELRSPSDSLARLQVKMQSYMDNGARLAWLIDPTDRTVRVYRPGQPEHLLERPDTVAGDPELPGFVLDLTAVWEPGL
jgi:Uma2 family endonuclease